MTQRSLLNSVRASFFCLAVLALVHCSLDIYLGKQAHLMMSILLWSSIASLLWDKRTAASVSQDKTSPVLGYILVAALLVISMIRPGEKVLGFFPVVAFLGWFLIFRSWSEHKLYLKEFGILIAFGLPKLVPDSAFGLAPITARFSTYLLWYMGYSVHLINNIYIYIPDGGVEVVPACSGMNLILHMLSISTIFLALFPIQKIHILLLPLMAIVLGFFMNGLRVAGLAILSPPKLSALFHYWHSAEGASIFVLLTLILYGILWFSFFKPVKQQL